MTGTDQNMRDKVLAEVDKIPTLPTAAVELMNLISGSGNDVDSGAVLAIVESDPGLCAKVLAIANSALYSRGFEIPSVRMALSRLGIKNLGTLVVDAAVEPVADVELPGYGLSSTDLWTHAVATAFATRAFASRLNVEDDGSMHVAGLLHNFGRIAMNSAAAQQLEELELDEGECLDEIEKRIIGIDSAEASACLIEHWRLPRNIADAVRFMRSPDDAPESARNTARIVHLADHACNCGAWGVGRFATCFSVSKTVLADLGVTPDIVEEVLELTMDYITEWRSSNELSHSDSR